MLVAFYHIHDVTSLRTIFLTVSSEGISFSQFYCCVFRAVFPPLQVTHGCYITCRISSVVIERSVGHARCSARKAWRSACELRLLHVIKISFIRGTSRLLSAISTIFSLISVFVSMVTVVVVLPKLHQNVRAKVA